MAEKSLFIVGTDTGIGKTVLSFLIVNWLFKKGMSPFYLKPFQTGCRDPYDRDSDAKFVYDNTPELNGKDPADSVCYCFKNPKAPFFAARDEGAVVDVKNVLDLIAEKAEHSSPLVIEGAGGVFVPVDKTHRIIDVLKKSGAQPVLAARAGLGTINHTLLTLEALKRCGVPEPGIVFIDQGGDPAPEGMIRENMEAVESFSGVAVSGLIGRIDDFVSPPPLAFDVISNLMDTMSK